MTAENTLARIIAVEPLDGYRLRLTFSDGFVREVDLADTLDGPVFDPVRDPEFFRRVKVDGGTIAWPNGADLDPDVLYWGGTPPWAQKHLDAAKRRAGEP